MKTILNGKRYDTQTAEALATWDNGHYLGDFHHCCETLYRTTNGAFFLHGEGGALSAYSQECGNNRGGGADIRPMTREDAFRWAQDRGACEAIEAHFADMIQDA
jgi:hypothetical protein